jgi:hypothetical protein
MEFKSDEGTALALQVAPPLVVSSAMSVAEPKPTPKHVIADGHEIANPPTWGSVCSVQLVPPFVVVKTTADELLDPAA